MVDQLKRVRRKVSVTRVDVKSEAEGKLGGQGPMDGSRRHLEDLTGHRQLHGIEPDRLQVRNIPIGGNRESPAAIFPKSSRSTFRGEILLLKEP